jgi:hypothetical protein
MIKFCVQRAISCSRCTFVALSDVGIMQSVVKLCAKSENDFCSSVHDGWRLCLIFISEVKKCEDSIVVELHEISRAFNKMTDLSGVFRNCLKAFECVNCSTLKPKVTCLFLLHLFREAMPQMWQ